MQRKISLALFLLLSLAAAPALAQKASSIRLAIQPTSYVTVASAWAVPEDHGVRITGVLARPGEVRLPGHVDVVVLGPDGALLDCRRIRVNGLQSNRRGRMEIPFSAVLAPDLPAGSQVLLRYHSPGDARGRC